MNIIIRTDASNQIGTGHAMRCLTLSEYLRDEGCTVSFVCREHPGHLGEIITGRGFSVHMLPFPESPVASDDPDNYAAWLSVSQRVDAQETAGYLIENRIRPDWLISDHYALDVEWEMMLRAHANRLMVIDDLANRRHDCDLLLDQNYYDDLDVRYDSVVTDACHLLLGPGYAILRKEFLRAKQEASRVRDGSIRRMLVFFGGCDSTNETGKVLAALREWSMTNVAVDVVVGLSNPLREQIKRECDEISSVMFHCQVDYMAELMSKADLAFGGGGTATWERCFLGLPCVTIEVADNQRIMLEALDRQGSIRHLGYHGKVTPKMIASEMDFLLARPETVKLMSEQAVNLVGDPGGDGRCPVVKTIMGFPETIGKRMPEQ